MSTEKDPSKRPAGDLLHRVWGVLSTVIDPELHFNIVDLGLVYDVEAADDGTVTVTMTLTSPACPYGPYLMHEVRTAVESLDAVPLAKLNMVWEPAWGPELMAEEVRLELGFDV